MVQKQTNYTNILNEIREDKELDFLLKKQFGEGVEKYDQLILVGLRYSPISLSKARYFFRKLDNTNKLSFEEAWKVVQEMSLKGCTMDRIAETLNQGLNEEISKLGKR